MTMQWVRTILVLVGLTLAATPGVAVEPVSAPSDTIPPKITPTYTMVYTLDNTAAATAKVTDNLGVPTVTLYYRIRGEQSYRALKLKQTASDLFERRIPVSHVQAPGLEYYIEATDTNGNTAVYGKQNNPHFMAYTAQTPTTTADTTTFTKPGKEKSLTAALNDQPDKPGSSKWIWITVGSLVASGAAYMALDDDEGGNSGNGSGRNEGSTITITTELPLR